MSKGFSVADSVALVTGANRGIGEAIVDALVATGARKVYAAARRGEDLDALLSRHGEAVQPLELDVTDSEQVLAAAQAASDVQLLINNAGVASYAMGAFELAPDQALVVTGTSPQCVFWNLCLWNPFLHTYDHTYERVTINGSQITYEPDGSWKIVISDRDPGHPNWVSTAGRSKGLIWLRWFLPEETPSRPQCRVVGPAELTEAVSG